MYSKILVPTDGSDGAIMAAEAGMKLAKQFDATIHTLYVIDTRFVAPDNDFVVEQVEHEAELALDNVGKLGNERDIAVEKHLQHGIAYTEILQAVKLYNADIIVMGTHGRTGLDRFIHLGSVTERVVRLSPIPVLAIPSNP